jgi:prepilin-type N-terminal cleavage/methylation domain-containing protein
MRRRQGFTLIELMVSVALIVLVLAVLAEAFAVGLDSFGKLKAVGDMADRLRGAAHQIRKDLASDHFEGAVRLSDANFGNPRKPACGFFQIKQFGPSVPEGQCDGVQSVRAPAAPGQSHILYMAVKRRGNRAEDFFAAHVPDSTLLGFPDITAYDYDPNKPNQPEDARRQNGMQPLYMSQWAEVAYFLQPMMESSAANVAPVQSTAKGTPLYTLHRVVRVIVPENRYIQNRVPRSQEPSYTGFSYRLSNPNYLTFNNPFDVVTLGNRSLKISTINIIDTDPSNPATPAFQTNDPERVSTMLLADVVSFTVQMIRAQNVDPQAGTPKFGFPLTNDFGDGNFDSNNTASGIVSVRIILRVWDLRSSRTQQITIVQDM